VTFSAGAHAKLGDVAQVVQSHKIVVDGPVPPKIIAITGRTFRRINLLDPASLLPGRALLSPQSLF
jgi:hypothetical protein